MISGVPFGAHVAWLLKSNTGTPLDLTRVAAVIQLAVTQGDGALETLNGHPATVKGAAMVTMAWHQPILLGWTKWAGPALHERISLWHQRVKGSRTYFMVLVTQKN